MATKPKPVLNAVPKPKRAKMPALPLAKRYEIMALVKNADITTPDSTLAAQASVLVGRQVQQQTISGYRKQFGIATVRKPGVRALQMRIALLEALITKEGFEVPA
jgi:hypothetical protein